MQQLVFLLMHTDRIMDALEFGGLRVTIFGLGREGAALARFLAMRGAHVTVTDVKPRAALTDYALSLATFPIHLELGGHPPRVLDTEVVFVSPGVPREIPPLGEARQRGMLLTSEPRLFSALCPARIIGITGSSGKTTTTTLVGEILTAGGVKVWVGGNIGEPLISWVEEISPRDLVVMELSSFQLEYYAPQPEVHSPPGWELLTPGYSPHIAAILNITPNHLDRHPSMKAYVEAKSHIYNHQHLGDVCVLGPDVNRQLLSPVQLRYSGTDTVCEHNLAMGSHRDSSSGGRVLLYSLESEVGEGAFLREGWIILRLAGREETVCSIDDIKLRGRHNVANVLAACAIAGSAGAPPEAMREAISRFEGVPHRLELVRELKRVRYYNDSIATSPERTCAALRSFSEPIVLLAGGRDKHLPWDEFARLALERARYIICFGEAAQLIAHKLRDHSTRLNSSKAHISLTSYRKRLCEIVSTLDEAVAVASSVAQPGDTVLLAPGCTSFDAFRDFEARGERFRELVLSLE